MMLFPGKGENVFANDKNNRVELMLNTDYNSRYVWRGYTFSTGSVFQPSVNASYKNININIWGNIDFTGQYTQKLNEVDYAVSYKIERNNFSIEPVLQFYTYPENEVGPYTGELTLRTAFYKGNFTISSSGNIDIKEYKGAFYADIFAGYDLSFNKNNSIALAAGIGFGNGRFNEGYGGLNKTALNALFFNISSSSTYGKFELKPRVEFSKILDEQLIESSGVNSVLNAGLTATLSF